MKLHTYAWELIKWRFSKSKYTGKFCIYQNRKRKIIAETFFYVRLAPVGKKGNQRISNLLIHKTQIKLLYNGQP